MHKVITFLSILLLVNTGNLFTMSLSDLIATQKELRLEKATHSKLFLSLDNKAKIRDYYIKRKEIINQLKQVQINIDKLKSDKRLSYNDMKRLDKTYDCLIKLYGKKQLLENTKNILISNAFDFKNLSEYHKALANINQQNYLILVEIAKVKAVRSGIFAQSLK